MYDNLENIASKKYFLRMVAEIDGNRKIITISKNCNCAYLTTLQDLRTAYELGIVEFRKRKNYTIPYLTDKGREMKETIFIMCSLLNE